MNGKGKVEVQSLVQGLPQVCRKGKIWSEENRKTIRVFYKSSKKGLSKTRVLPDTVQSWLWTCSSLVSGFLLWTRGNAAGLICKLFCVCVLTCLGSMRATAYPLRSGTMQGSPILAHLFNILEEVLIRAIRKIIIIKKKINKGNPN